MKFLLQQCVVVLALLFVQPAHAQWTQLSTGATSNINCVRHDAGGQVWAGTTNGILRSSNSGSTFNFVNGINTSAGSSQILGTFDDIHVTSAQSAFAAGFFYLGNDLIIFGTLNNGNSWSHNYYSTGGSWPRNIEAFDFSPAGKGVGVGGAGRVLVSSNNGISWATGSSGTSNTLYDVSWVNGTTWVAVSGSNIYRSTNDGLSFNNILGNLGNIENVSFTPGTNTGYAGGSNELKKSTDGGLTWTTVNIPAVSIRTIFTYSPDTVYIGTYEGVYRSVSGGLYWERFDLPGYQWANDIYFYDADHGMIAGDSGYVAITNNGGGVPYPVSNFSLPVGTPCQGTAITPINYGDPAWTYEWFINGTSVSTQFAPSLTLSSPWTNTIALITTKNGLSDTLTRSVNVTPTPLVQPFTVINDTICQGGQGQFRIPNSQQFVSYALFDGTVQVGSSQAGTGNTVTLTTATNQTTVKTYRIRAIYSNTCGADTLEVFDSLWIATPNPAVSVMLYRDTICTGDTTSVLIYNSEPGWDYYTSNNQFQKIDGTGGTIIIPVGPATSNLNFTVVARLKGLNCLKTLPGNYTVTYRATSATINPGTLQGGVGQPLTITAGSSGFNNWTWDFGPNATPGTASGQVPTAPTYSTAGIDTVILTARLNSTCEKIVKKPIYIWGSLPASNTLLCDLDTFSGAMASTVTETYFDEFNNLHVAGYNSQSTNFAFIPFIMRLDTNGRRTYYHSFNSTGNNPGAQGLINGLTTDRLTNTYMATRYTAPARFDVQGNYMRNKNAIIKLNEKGSFQWAIEAPLADFSDMITINNRIFAVGINAWKGCEFQTPDGNYQYTPSISNKGDAFIMEINPEGKILSFDAFGTSGPNTPAKFKVKYPIANQYFDYDTLRQNLMARPAANGEMLIAGMLDATTITSPVLFNNLQVGNSLPAGTAFEKCIFISRYNLTNGFSNAVTLMSGQPEFISDFKETNNGHYVVVGRAKNKIVTSNGTFNFPVQNYEYQFIASFSPTGAMDWYVYADSMSFKSVATNPDGSVSLLAAMPTKFLIVDALGNPFNVSPTPVFGSYLLRFGSNGELLSADRTANYTGVAMHQDICGNQHVFHSTGNPVQFRTIRTIHSQTGSCGSNCYSAYNPNLLDAAIDSVNLSDKTTNGPAVRNMDIKVKSKSVLPINALEIKYRINNDAEQSINWNGSLQTGDSINLAVNNYNFSKAYNRIRVWIHRVNGVTDDQQGNDTLILQQIICSAPLAGTYSAGCDTCYFDHVQASATTLKTCGVADPVTIAIEPGIYGEQIEIDSIPFASSADTIVWTSRTGIAEDVTIKLKPDYSYFRTLFNLRNLSYCSFVHLTLINHLPKAFDAMQADGGGRSVFYFQNSRHINISDCRMFGIEQTGGAIGVGHIIDAYDGYNFRFTNNYFQNGEAAISLGGSLTPTRNVQLSGNTAKQTKGFWLYNLDSVLIDRNRIETIGSITAAKIQCNECDSFRIINNLVTSEDWGDEVFYLYSNSSTTNYNLVANNIFSSSPLWLSTPGAYINASNTDIIHNSFGHGLELYTSGGLNFVNNLVRSNGSSAVEISSPTFITSWNNNRYQSVGSPINFINNGNNYSLAGWRSATGFDAQSDSVTAEYTTLTDMHLRNTVAMPGIPWPGITTDIDGQPRSLTAPTIGADEYSFDPLIGEVWPGDCDSSKTVDNFDLLPIALYLNRYSTSRPNEPSTSWNAQPSLLWNESQTGGINLHHADANGDGWIDLEDTTTVIANYGQSRPLANPDPQRPTIGPDLAVIPASAIYNAGDTVHLKVMAGSSLLPVDQLSAIGFKVDVPPGLIIPGTYTVSIANNWLCPDSNCIMYRRADESSGTAAVSLARLDGDQVSSYGELADISFVINAAYSGSTTINIPLSDYRSFEPDANPISLSPLDGVIQVLGTSINEESSLEDFTLYPNPTNSITTLLFNRKSNTSEKATLQIIDLTGRVVSPEQNILLTAGVQQVPMDCSGLQPGVYLVRLISGTQQITVRLIRQ